MEEICEVTQPNVRGLDNPGLLVWAWTVADAHLQHGALHREIVPSRGSTLTTLSRLARHLFLKSKTTLSAYASVTLDSIRRRPPVIHCTIGMFMALTLGVSGATREVPTPLPENPGNIFLEGTAVTIPVPANSPPNWQLRDYADQLLAQPSARDGAVHLGLLPVGFYRLQQVGAAAGNWISAGVLAPLSTPTPRTSPVALDVASAWFYPPEKMAAVANLCALAGVNRVRDRLTWSQMEPQRGEFAGSNRYDASAQAQADAGLQVLQVHHASPAWANPHPKRFPLDLRDAYRFHREMARRWSGKVVAFEPWNEADISVFGGHTGSEMASLQKAAYLGIKAGNPDAIACLNVFAAHRQTHLQDLHDNDAWPYFDTFNLHHYEPFEKYPQLYAAFRSVSAGRPLWVTECALPVKWAGDNELQEPTDADLRVQAERVAKTFALSLHEGAAATFYFLLPHYVEGQTQFGILRRDLTPRPAFVALAAVGRLLADAKPLGRLSTPPTQEVYAFAAKPAAVSRVVLVAWDTKGGSVLKLPAPPEALFDHLGRPFAEGAAQAFRREVKLTSAPIFIVLSFHSAETLKLTPPPTAPPRLGGTPSSIVFQALWPEDQVLLNKSAYRLTGVEPERISVWAYNFGDTAATGRLGVTAPPGWKFNFPATVQLPPLERVELALTVEPAASARGLMKTIRITGDFGSAGNPVLSLKLLNPGAGVATALLTAAQSDRWQRSVSGDGQLHLEAADNRLLVEAQCGGEDRWAYPTLRLNEDEIPPPNTEALGLTFKLLEGDGQFRVIFEEANGSAYVADFMTPPRPGETIEALAFLEGAVHGATWSKPDANHRLDAGQIRVIKIGCNTSAKHLRFSFGNLRWVRFQETATTGDSTVSP